MTGRTSTLAAERHKGGRVRGQSVGTNGGGGGSSGSGGNPGGDVADVWAAAGMEHARAAAAYQCATMDACRHSWKARVDVGNAMRDAAVANGRVAGEGEGGRVSRGAIAEVGRAMQHGIDALDSAAVEFSLAAKLSAAAADGWARAEEALGRAGHGWAGTAREQSDEARLMAQTLRGWEKKSRMSADALRRSAGEWVEGTAEWRDGGRLPADRDQWMERQGELVDVANDELTMAREMARSTDTAARVATKDLARVATEARRQRGAAALAVEKITSARAAAASGGGGPGSDALREAVDALQEGVDAASQAVRDR